MSVQISNKKHFFLGILFMIIFFIFVFLIVEIYYQITDVRSFIHCSLLNAEAYQLPNEELRKKICYDSQNFIFFDLHISYVEPNQHFDTINTNSHGFRGPEILKEKPENTFRIFVIGGSTAFGWGSTSDSTTIPGFLQKKFDDANLNFKVEVINAGVPGVDSYLETIYIKHELLDFQPDLFIIYTGRNDVRLNEIKRENYRFDKLEIDTKLEKSFFDEINYSFRKLTLYLKAPLVIEQFVKDTFYGDLYSSTKLVLQDDLNGIVSDWKKRWSIVCKVGQEKGFDTLIVLQPFAGTSDGPPEEEKKYISGKVNQDILLAYPSFANGLDELNNYCTKTSDLRNVFDGFPYSVYFDRAHLSDHGNQIMAEKIFDLALPLVLEKGVS